MKPTEFLREFDELPQHNGGAEYNDEVGSVKDNLHTIVRMCKILAKTLQDNENLPEWAQEKVAKANGMLVSVADYIISQHEQGKVYSNEAMMSGGMNAYSIESAQRQYEELLGETTTAGSVATVPATGGGSLFGGNYTNPDNPFAKKTKKTKIIKR